MMNTPNNKSNSRPSIVVLGGGHGGIRVAKSLEQIADVTLVDPGEAFVNVIPALRALVQPEWLDRIFFPYGHMIWNGHFIRDRAVSVDGRRVKLKSGDFLKPDYLILATGSSYPFPAKNEEVEIATAQAKIHAAHKSLSNAKHVLIIGAGPTGLELAGEIKTTFPDKQVTIVTNSTDILPGSFPQELRDALWRQIKELNIEIKLDVTLTNLPATPVATLGQIKVNTGNGTELIGDIWFRAFGVHPSTGYLRNGTLSDRLDDQGYIRVDEHLRVSGETNIFAIGDMTDADRNLAAVASYQAEMVAVNIQALITGNGELKSWKKFDPNVLLIPLGPSGGAGWMDNHLLGPAEISQIKGKDMLSGLYAPLFNSNANKKNYSR